MIDALKILKNTTGLAIHQNYENQTISWVKYPDQKMFNVLGGWHGVWAFDENLS